MPLGSSVTSLCTCASELASIDTKLLVLDNEHTNYYGGMERIIGNLTGTPHNLARIRELLTLRSGGVDELLLNNLQPFQRLLMEYQLKRDIQGDGKIYGWDYVHIDDPSTPTIEEPQPILRGIAFMPEVAEKILYGRIETIPGDMPIAGDYNGPKAGIFGFVGGDTWDSNLSTHVSVSMHMTGPAAADTKTFTNSGGYRFAGLDTSGSYKIRPSSASYTFDPESRLVSIDPGLFLQVPPNVTEVDFTATAIPVP